MYEKGEQYEVKRRVLNEYLWSTSVFKNIFIYTSVCVIEIVYSVSKICTI